MIGGGGLDCVDSEAVIVLAVRLSGRAWWLLIADENGIIVDGDGFKRA